MEIKESFNVVSFYFNNDKFMEYFYEGIHKANTSSKYSHWTGSITAADFSVWKIMNEVTFPGLLDAPKLPGFLTLKRSRSSNKISISAGLIGYNGRREEFYKDESVDFNFYWYPDRSTSLIEIDLCGVYDFKKPSVVYESGRFRINHDLFSGFSRGFPVLTINTEGLVGYDPYRLHLNCYAIICRELVGSIGSLYNRDEYTEEIYKNRRSFMERALGIIEGEINLPPL